MSTTYTPMLSRDGTCLLMPNGPFVHLDKLMCYDPGKTAAAQAGITSPYVPMLSRDRTCLLMDNGTFVRLDTLPRSKSDTAAQATPAPTAAPVATASTKPASKE